MTNDHSQRKRQGLAIASMVIGILSCLSLGVLGIGSITSIMLGAIALKKTRREPDQFGGRGFAIVGIITGIISGILSLLLYSVLTYKFLFNPSTR